ncbi:MAG TPA: DUF4202 domain-containing protein [Verrucomicrobiae bacterium]|nr:DUF4202 domain-containing protein [Verrucomicrobiae bacterium]
MNQTFGPAGSERFAAAVRRFDEENSRDPNHQLIDGKQVPGELAYSRWLTQWVLRLKPDASEPLLLAARAAHLRRWTIARDSYPATRAGYLRWRSDLKKFHAEMAGAILREVGYGKETIAQVQGLISKSAFPQEAESRTLEDALCLVFLEYQFAELAQKASEEKMVNALRKTWQKMTPSAQAIALTLKYDSHLKVLLGRALEPDPPARAHSGPQTPPSPPRPSSGGEGRGQPAD